MILINVGLKTAFKKFTDKSKKFFFSMANVIRIDTTASSISSDFLRFNDASRSTQASKIFRLTNNLANDLKSIPNRSNIEKSLHKTSLRNSSILIRSQARKHDAYLDSDSKYFFKATNQTDRKIFTREFNA